MTHLVATPTYFWMQKRAPTQPRFKQERFLLSRFSHRKTRATRKRELGEQPLTEMVSRAARAILLIVFLLLGCFSAPQPQSFRDSNDELSQKSSQHHEVIVLPLDSKGSSLQVFDGHRLLPQPALLAFHYLLSTPVCFDFCPASTDGVFLFNPIDMGRALFVLVGPNSPRSPPAV